MCDVAKEVRTEPGVFRPISYEESRVEAGGLPTMQGDDGSFRGVWTTHRSLTNDVEVPRLRRAFATRAAARALPQRWQALACADISRSRRPLRIVQSMGAEDDQAENDDEECHARQQKQARVTPP